MTEDFRLGEWIVRPHQSCFCRGDTEVKVDPKAMQVLVRVSEDGGEIVGKETSQRMTVNNDGRSKSTYLV